MLGTTIIYASNIVVVRYSLNDGMGINDLVAVRFLVAGFCLLPYFLALGWRDLGGLGFGRGVVLTVLGGAPYMVFFFFGLSLAPVAHSSVLNPGLVPSFVFFLSVALGLAAFSFWALAPLAIIVVGLVLVTSASFSGQTSVLLGDVILLSSGLSWALFTLLLRLWSLAPLQAAAVVSVMSLPYVFGYLLLADAPLSTATWQHFAWQAIYQGLVVTIAAIVMLAYAVRGLGAQTTALFAPLIPVGATLAGALFLGESVTVLQAVGIALVAIGMIWGNMTTAESP